ncbi:hypothetical protein CAP35_05940 [Chitinophagaceae bacterium IBVUCB1]|nr:hypothetical protein CAP35_05940 [Chitinophagaceae bacterium IBVUCB1]
MAVNFTSRIIYKGTGLLAVIVPQHRKNGLFYEVNIAGYPRFYMTKTVLDRFDITGDEKSFVPYELVLAVSDAIEVYNHE